MNAESSKMVAEKKKCAPIGPSDRYIYNGDVPEHPKTMKKHEKHVDFYRQKTCSPSVFESLTLCEKP